MIYQDLTEHRNGKVHGDEISVALEHILTSRPFRSSNQCSNLLRYIVEHTLAGEETLLRERVIGSELFGRPPDYETSEDPVVRLRASEVRKRLAQYYLSDRDQRKVQIDIPPGSYRATFHWNAGLPSEVTADDSGGSNMETLSAPASVPPGEFAVLSELGGADNVDAPRVSQTAARSNRAVLAAVAVVIFTLAGSIALFRAYSPDRAFRVFWTPWTDGTKPVIVSIGSNAVYRFQSDYLDRYAEQHGLKNAGQDFYVPLEKGQTLSADDLFAAYDSFVALGDVAAVSRIVATLTEAKKPYRERFPNDVSFAELREDPSILVGGFNNPMTLELTKQLEFVMRGGNEIIDTMNPKRTWRLDPVNERDTADWAIITRIVQRNGDAPFIGVAGLGQWGTLAAAELIGSASGIHLITDQLPKGWSDRNLQVVVRISVVDYKPSASAVVASRSW